MAHFAEIDANNVVLRVIVVADEHEAYGENWCRNLFGGNWKQTSYNNRMRKNYAGTGYVYDPERDAFIPPQPFASWVLDEATCQWVAPVPHPADGDYDWNEPERRWVERGA